MHLHLPPALRNALSKALEDIESEAPPPPAWWTTPTPTPTPMIQAHQAPGLTRDEVLALIRAYLSFMKDSFPNQPEAKRE